MLKLPDVREANVQGKKVFLRLDLDVPIEYQISNIKYQISDDSRLLGGMETLNYLLKNGAMVLIAGHLGRPADQFEKRFSLEPIAEWFSARLEVQSKKSKIGEFDAWKIGESITLLENLRFFKEEGHNDPVFSEKLAKLAEIYVNDAFAASHRSHASIVGVPKFLPHFAGIRFQKETEELSKVIENPQRPLTVIVGGAKIETKLPLIEKMHGFADYVLVGGQIAKETKTLLKIQHEKIGGKKGILFVADSNSDGTDISYESVENFVQVINSSQTIVWNGPVGKIPEGERGSKELANAISKSSAHTVVGGGDTVSFLKKEGLLDKFSFVSTGGGAMLEFLSGQPLPGIEALQK